MTDLDERIAALEAERRAIQRDLLPKQERLIKIHEELRPLQERKSGTWIKEMGDTPDWPLIIRVLAGNSPLSSVALLNYVIRKLEPYSMYQSGFWGDTGDGAFKVQITNGNPTSLQRATEGVRFFTPLMTPHKDGYVWFGIFEHSLSAHGGLHSEVTAGLLRR